MTPKRRGRPRSPEPLSQYVVIRLTADQRARLDEIAALNHQSATAFVRQALDEATADCSDRRIFS
jgi:uncharacterized protein (DUF1778 family)